MKNKFVRSDYDTFMGTFVPDPTSRGVARPDFRPARGELKKVPRSGPEAHMYDPLMKALNNDNICTAFRFVVTQYTADKVDRDGVKPDLNAYRLEDAERIDVSRHPDLSRIKLGAELKGKRNQDPWDDRSGKPFESESDIRMKNRGQAIDYAAKIANYQHLRFLFTLNIAGDHARIVRWDRGGAIVTEAFDYQEDPDKLLEFVWRFNNLTDLERGADPTATAVEPGSDDYELMESMSKTEIPINDTARRIFQKTLDKNHVWYKLSVVEELSDATAPSQTNPTNNDPIAHVASGSAPRPPASSSSSGTSSNEVASDSSSHHDKPIPASRKPNQSPDESNLLSLDTQHDKSQHTASGSESSAQVPPPQRAEPYVRHYLVGAPWVPSTGMIGRATRGFVGLDRETREFVFLKDCWRVDADGMKKEGDILRELNSKGVRNIPTFTCHGDVYEEETQTVPQKSQTAAFWQQLNSHDVSDSEKKGSTNPFKTHIHYRLVVKEVAVPLQDFTKSRNLVKVIRRCVVAHCDAWVKAGVLHRDVSTGNVLMYRTDYIKNGERKYEVTGLLTDWELSKHKDDLHPRQSERSGTWQYMSARVLLGFDGHTVADDLESFFHVLLWNALRFLLHNCEDVGTFFTAYFDEAKSVMVKGKERHCGGETKLRMVLQGKIMDASFQNEPLIFTRNNPLNETVSTITAWLRDRYKKMQDTRDIQRDKADPSVDITELYSGPIESDSDDTDDDSEGPEKLKMSVVMAPNQAAAAATYPLAEQLDTHEAILYLLGEELKKKDEWPKLDRLNRDQLPRKDNFPSTMPPDPSTTPAEPNVGTDVETATNATRTIRARGRRQAAKTKSNTTTNLTTTTNNRIRKRSTAPRSKKQTVNTAQQDETGPSTIPRSRRRDIGETQPGEPGPSTRTRSRKRTANEAQLDGLGPSKRQETFGGGGHTRSGQPWRKSD